MFGFAFFDWLKTFVPQPLLAPLSIVGPLVVGFVALYALSLLIRRIGKPYLSEQILGLIGKVVLYGGALALIALAIHARGLDIKAIVATGEFKAALRILLILFVGFPLLRYLCAYLQRATQSRLSDQARMILNKAVFYSGSAILAVMLLSEFGLNLTVLMTTAGIAGVAIAFASQSSFANIISGLFLISEKPFAVGDEVEIGANKGIVHSIDLLSVKLRTFDNRLVRIPNESIFKTNVINSSRFPIRRLDINLSVPYHAPINRVVDLLKEIADQNPYCLDEPAPAVVFDKIGESSLDVFVGVWCAQEDYMNLKLSIMSEIKRRLDAEGVRPPIPAPAAQTPS